MSQPKKNRISQPARLTGPMPPVEIIEAYPVPRKFLVAAFRIDPGLDPSRAVLSTARFISSVQAADRWLRLAIDPTPARAADGEVSLTFTPARHGVEVAAHLEKLVEVVRGAAGVFEGATLSRLEVVQRV